MSHIIDEYKELRSEIRYYMEAGQKNENLALVVFGVTLAAHSIDSYAFLVFGAILILYVLWVKKTRCTKAVLRVGAYIQVFIEPEVEGLQWETRGSNHHIHSRVSGWLLRVGVFPCLICILALLGVFSLNICLCFMVTLSMTVVPALIIPGIIMTVRLARQGRDVEVVHWRATRRANDGNTREKRAGET